jgi:hypothetical protein
LIVIMARHASMFLLGAFALLLSGCGEGVRTVGRDEYVAASQRTQTLRDSGASTEGMLLFGTDRSAQQQRAEAAGSGISVNAYLWRATLDTLSFMPLASADPFGGTIITEWYAPPGANDERFRAQAYVMGRQLRSDGVRVQVFRQTLDRGQWVDSPVSAATNAELEDKVLARARELRSQTASR